MKFITNFAHERYFCAGLKRHYKRPVQIKWKYFTNELRRF